MKVITIKEGPIYHHPNFSWGNMKKMKKANKEKKTYGLAIPKRSLVAENISSVRKQSVKATVWDVCSWKEIFENTVLKPADVVSRILTWELDLPIQDWKLGMLNPVRIKSDRTQKYSVNPKSIFFSKELILISVQIKITK